MLFTIETDQVRLVWSRSRTQAAALPPGGPLGLSVEAIQPGVVPVAHVHAPGAAPLLEQTDYLLFVQSRTAVPVGLRHRNAALLRGCHPSDGGRVLHGTLNFGAQVGRSRFVVEVDGRPHLAFEVEVFPSKLDYRQDYEVLLQDVREITTGLILEYLQSTFRCGAPAPDPRPEAPAWAALLEHAMGALEQSISYIAAHPRWGAVREPALLRAEQVRRAGAGLQQAVGQGAGRGPWQVLAGGLPVRAWLPEHPSRYTLDTPEHRWLAGQIAHIRARLAAHREAERLRRSGARRTSVLRALEDLQHRAARLAARLPAARTGTVPAPTLRLRTAPGYREAYRACLMLQHGLSLEDGPAPFELKHLHLLYEYWCFLTLVRLAAEETGQRLPAERLLRVERQGLRVRLRKGRPQTVHFTRADGLKLTLSYNPRFSGPRYVVPQQPDIVLTLHRPGSLPARFILDAKYRLDSSPAYRQRYGTPGPPADALNDLHRYRDAILDRAQQRRTVAQAAALFPHREEAPGAFAASRLGRMLQEVGVGALPLLPGETHHLRAWLQDVLASGGREA